MSAPAFPSGYEALRRDVLQFGRVRKRWAVLEGLGLFLLAGPGVLLLWFLLDWALGLPAWPLVLGFGLACAASLYALARWGVRPWLRRVRLHGEALTIETLHGELDNQIIGSLQLAEELARLRRDDARPAYSARLVERLVERTAAALEELRPASLLDLSGPRRAVAAGAAVVALALALGLAAPGAVAARADRLSAAWATVLDTLFPVTMTVEPGDTAVVRGRPVLLRVRVEGARRDEVTLHYREDEADRPARQTLPLARPDGDGPAVAEVRREAVETAFTYAFEYGGQRSAEYRVEVGDLPELSAISYELVYPAYTGQPPRTLTGRVPELSALPGTGVLVSFAATTELHDGLSYVEWQDGARQALTVNGRFAHFSFTVTRPEEAVVHLTGIHGPGFEMPKPLRLRVGLERDRAPSVRIPYRQRELVMLAEEAQNFAVPYLAEDDFGVAELTLNYRIEPIDKLLGRPVREGEAGRAVEPARDRVKGVFEEVFANLDPALQPGDRLTIEVRGRDNNTESGPGLGRSRPLTIVVVRPDLGAFTEKDLSFRRRAAVLSGLKKVKRVTGLLVEPEKTVRTEEELEIVKQDVKARVEAEPWPSGSEDMVGSYFRLLSGGD